jgi:hypothetical protein
MLTGDPPAWSRMQHLTYPLVKELALLCLATRLDSHSVTGGGVGDHAGHAVRYGVG